MQQWHLSPRCAVKASLALLILFRACTGLCWTPSTIRKTRSKSAARKVSRPRFRPRFDVLEDRMVPSGVTVINTSNSSTVSGSLPWAVSQANSDTSGGPFTINFDPTVFATPQTIALAATLNLDNPTSGESIIIDGPAATLTIKGGGSLPHSYFSVMEVADSVTLVNLTISNGNSYFGGGISNNGALNLSNCTLCNNAAVIYSIEGMNTIGGEGGGIYNNDTVTLSNCTLSNNTAEVSGGGIFINAGTVTVTNSTFSGNGSESGGGIQQSGGTLTISDSTISGNSSGIAGGGISIGTGVPTLNNTIVAGNNPGPDSSGDPDIDGSVAAASAYNLIGDGTGMSGISNGDANHNQVGTSSTPINPDLGPLQNNGGPTETMALQTGSPAIKASEIVNGIMTDQRGDRRPAMNPDIGAYQTPASLVVTGTSFAYSTTSNTYTVDGTQYTFNPAQYTSIQFTGTGTGTASLTDTSGKAAVILHPNSGIMRWGGLAIPVNVTGVATIYVFGASGDIATLMDAPGATNTFNGRPTDSSLQGTGYLNRVYYFSQVWAGSETTSNDIAYVTAAPGNTGFFGSECSATTGCHFGGPGYLNTILGGGFKTISAIAPTGSNTAYLTSTVATDRFYGTPTNSYIYDPVSS